MMDEHLLARIAQADQAAFAQFYDRHSGRILALLRRILRDEALADDALQEAFWQVWRRAGSYDRRRSSVTGWLIVLARSRALDLARQRRREPTPPARTAAAPDNAAETASAAEVSAAVGQALAGLPPEQRSAIHMAFFCGLTQEQIARETGLALGTVKTRIRRGIHRLREDAALRGRALA